MKLSGVARLPKPDRSARNLAHNCILLTINRDLSHVRHFLDDTFNLRRINLLTTDVDDVGRTSQNSEILPVYLDFVAGVKPPIIGEWARCIEIAKHRRLRFHLENAIYNACLETFAT